MATSQIASMLDELMGRNRNVAPDEDVKELEWSDPEICRFYLVQFCPHDLFTNTKADLGPCPKIHDDDLKAKFTAEPRDNYRKSGYIDDFLRFCQRMLTELSSRIKKAKERLVLSAQQQQEALNALHNQGNNKESLDKINLLSDKINQLVTEAENEGTKGNVEQAQGLMKLCDTLREERDNLRNSLNSENSLPIHQKAMEVCDVCGAFLIVGDAQQRIDDHLMGKQHLGYARLRAVTDKIMDERRKYREEKDKEADERRKKRAASPFKKDADKSRQRSRRSRSRSLNRRKRRSRSSDRRDHRSDRSRHDRNDRRRRSRSNERRRRSRSRDNNRRNRHSQRDRSGSRHRRRRSRSHHRRSRSRSESDKNDKSKSSSSSQHKSEERGSSTNPNDGTATATTSPVKE